MGLTREALLKGKDQYDQTPCANEFLSATFQTESFFFLFYKTTYLNEEVNHTDPSPSVRLPWFYLFEQLVVYHFN
jgi:hypothetical protein